MDADLDAHISGCQRDEIRALMAMADKIKECCQKTLDRMPSTDKIKTDPDLREAARFVVECDLILESLRS